MKITEKGWRLQRKNEDYRECKEITEKGKRLQGNDGDYRERWRLQRKNGDHRERMEIIDNDRIKMKGLWKIKIPLTSISN